MCICVNTSYLALNLIFEDHRPSSESAVKYAEREVQIRKQKAQSVKVLSLELYLCSILVILHGFGGSFDI